MRKCQQIRASIHIWWHMNSVYSVWSSGFGCQRYSRGLNGEEESQRWKFFGSNQTAHFLFGLSSLCTFTHTNTSRLMFLNTLEDVQYVCTNALTWSQPLTLSAASDTQERRTYIITHCCRQSFWSHVQAPSHKHSKRLIWPLHSDGSCVRPAN